MNPVLITECPRDAMQGLNSFIPTDTKKAYLNALLDCGFDTLDFGSFVSPKAIPQMRDTPEVLGGLKPSTTKLLAIVANERGAIEASSHERIHFLGYPFSVSPTFQLRNTNVDIDASLSRVETIQNLCLKTGKEAMIYISMAFGNPYGDEWHPDLVTRWCERLHTEIGIRHVALSDTIGVSTPESILTLFKTVLSELPHVHTGAHLHTTPETWEEKLEAAYTAGCRRFDGAIKGYGGCPMAKDDLTGNMPTDRMNDWFTLNGIKTGVNQIQFEKAVTEASALFSAFAN